MAAALDTEEEAGPSGSARSGYLPVPRGARPEAESSDEVPELQPWPRARRALAIAASSVLLAVSAAAVGNGTFGLQPGGSSPLRAPSRHSKAIEFAAVNGQPPSQQDEDPDDPHEEHHGPNAYYYKHHEDKARCGLSEEDTWYWGRKKPFRRLHTDTEDACRNACLKEPMCTVWSWGKTQTPAGYHICNFLRLEQFEIPWSRHKVGMVSGNLPCDTTKLVPPQTLYCFALMQPQGYEKGILAMQKSRGLSLFACDAYAVYSNQAITVAPGVVSGVINSTLKCAMGGEFGTALNLEIFLVLWKKVIADGVYKNFGWTVKVDPDAVFFPQTLRKLLAHHPEANEGVYLNNCKYGMHGPIEVFSRNGVEAFAKGRPACEAHFKEQCGGVCEWGEDMYVDQCLLRVLRVRRDDEWSLLVEDHCSPNPKHPYQWSTLMCTEFPGRVAYHPFKTEAGYQECIAKEAVGRSKAPSALH